MQSQKGRNLNQKLFRLSWFKNDEKEKKRGDEFIIALWLSGYGYEEKQYLHFLRAASSSKFTHLFGGEMHAGTAKFVYVRS